MAPASGSAPPGLPPPAEGESALLRAARLGELAWFEVDAEHRVVRWSEGAALLTGFTEAEAMGLPCIAAVRCHRCLSGCRIFEVGAVDGRTGLFHKDGRELRVHKTGEALRDSAGNITGAVEVLRLEPEPPALDRSVEAMTRALHRLWLAADAEYRIVDLSGGVTELTDRSRDQLLGMPLAQLMGGELWAPGSPFRSALEQGQRREGRSASLLTARGERLPVSVSAGQGPDGRLHVMIRPQLEAETRGYTEFEGMVGRSPAMLRLFRMIEVLGDNDATVLITGESGTGKELVARALHNHSARRSGPFVAVNCGAIPAELLESELFGHVRGAFTGAFRDRSGRFEAAAGGTLFLDEVGDLPLSLQVKLLRVLEDHGFQRLGESRTRTVDTRVIAATNARLRQAVADRRFREDLYYRLRVLPIEVPPLRERPEDLEPLIRHFLARIGLQQGRALQLGPAAQRALLAWPWPGNVRELLHCLEYATAVCEGQTLQLQDLPPELRGVEDPAPAQQPQAPGPEHDEKQRIQEALARARYRREDAAAALGLSRTTLWRKMKQLGIT